MVKAQRVYTRAERLKERAALRQHSLQLYRAHTLAHTNAPHLLAFTGNHRLDYCGGYNFIFAAYANACDVIIKTVITTLK